MKGGNQFVEHECFTARSSVFFFVYLLKIQVRTHVQKQNDDWMKTKHQDVCKKNKTCARGKEITSVSKAEAGRTVVGHHQEMLSCSEKLVRTSSKVSLFIRDRLFVGILIDRFIRAVVLVDFGLVQTTVFVSMIHVLTKGAWKDEIGIVPISSLRQNFNHTWMTKTLETFATLKRLFSRM